MVNTNQRPLFLDLRRIHMPVTAVISIGHRLTGILLFLLLPFMLYLFEMSLRGPEGFEQAAAWLAWWPMKLITVLIIGWYGYHLLAGVRLLLIDSDVGSDLPGARRGAWSVLAGSGVILLVALLLIL
ncbi:succinate dehydrogenase, cytochrome b556 subunit [Thiohalomonas denitrificans]|uniref:Succinate dehydrogenase cytochrome b556 subunit n=1 Tax=Thiohalomonas denitrificans TaxID=415747 RepID=A0A1G5QN91_9GAMM|nr:succinate dehydrogenase, cytochrome b556 subunit [Thiohalomonas denitrificans]SCZ63202.1 succinate dehydrogenase subunit C [Thiohalomonas denitrificans]